MRLVIAGIFVTGLAGMAQIATAQGNWQPQASPSPTPPPPVYVSPPAPPPALRPPSGKERPARPITDPGTWVTNDAYPAESAKNGEQGTTAFRLTIDPTGRVTACTITSSSGYDRLDFAACELMQANGRFSPALDKKGKPTTGSWASRFKWVLPPRPSLPQQPTPAPFISKMSFYVEPDGSVSNCTLTGDAGQGFTAELGPCGQKLTFKPFRDPAGNAVRKKISMTLTLNVSDPDGSPSDTDQKPEEAIKPPVRPKQP